MGVKQCSLWETRVSILHPGPKEGEGRGRRTSFLASAHAMIFHTPFPWHHGCAISHVSITHVTRHTTPAQSLRAGGGLAFRHACIPPDTQGLHAEARHLTQGTAWAYSLTLSSHTLHQHHAPILYSCLSPRLCHRLGVQHPSWLCLSHLYTPMCSPCIRVPGAVCDLRFLSLPPACQHQSLFQEPMCQARRRFFDSSTLSAKCIQIWTALSALEKWNNSKYLVNFMVINTPNQADELEKKAFITLN